ncbi:MAG: hypothetical protein IPM42_16160 [Saprospiraceae bacterium]|nr:hypothetical protein [Saprospiraceae bacterium]
MNKKIHFILIFISFILIWSCKDSGDIIPDVSHIQPEFQIINTQSELFKKVSSLDEKSLDAIISTNPAFYGIYFQIILPLYKGNDKDSLITALNDFKTETQIKKLIDTVHQVFPDTKQLSKEFETYFKYLQYYFPERSAPDIYTFISEFSYQVFIFEDDAVKDAIGVGLDMFLGQNFDYKMVAPDNPAFSDYLTRSWNKDHIVRKVSDLIVSDIVGEANGIRLLDKMVHNGKILYITKKLMPEAHDSIILDYTETQLEWCRNNELEMWAFFFDRNLFYETNLNKVSKYIQPSPDSPGMPAGAPGRTANFLGWKIVEAYMKRFPDLTIDELIENKDAQKLLELSKYKPKRK